LFESIRKAVNSSGSNHRLPSKVKGLGQYLPAAAGNLLALLVNLEMIAGVRSLNLDGSDSVRFYM